MKNKGLAFLRKTSKMWQGLTVVSAAFLSLFLVLTDMGERYEGFINDRLGITNTGSSGTAEHVYKSRFGELNVENCKKLIEEENNFNIQAMEEGAVLLRNENNALPFADSERKVTLFGNNVADPVYATNGGGSSFKKERGGDIYTAFTNAGFKVNKTMYDAYVNSNVRRVSNSNQGEGSIGEVPISFYTDGLKASFANDYNDAAIVLFTRYGGEGVDLQVKDADGVPMLSLHQQEKDLLKMIKDSGKFKKTIVLINSPFAMDLEWIEKEEYGIDACLQFGAAGDVGFIGIANILTGKASPSGHLSDTYATSSLSAPAMQNFGNFKYSNHTTQYEDSYVVYAENIYVGYKYYETRYQDQVLGLNNATGNYGVFAGDNGVWDYSAEMAYPFGYGLSYSEFTEKLESVTWENHQVKATISVTNNGPKEGSNYKQDTAKHVVQLYVQQPYEKGQAEKSAINLIGFDKVELKTGETKTVEIVADDYLFASYDENAINGSDTTKKGCYVLDAGDYHFAIGSSSHDALNNIISAKNSDVTLYDEKGNEVEGDSSKVETINLETLDNVTHSKSKVTDEVISNKLDDIDYNYYGGDEEITYLTRSDWSTFPKSYGNLEASDNLLTALKGLTYKKDDNDKYESVTAVNSDIKFCDLADVKYDDEETWEKFLDQLTLSELASITGEKMGNDAVGTGEGGINKPYNSNTDGPKGIGSVYAKGDKSGITLYVDEVTMASTFNLDLLKERGSLFAEDALYSGYSMVFGPGADWHRTQYSGRNSEYYSEDPNLSLLCGAAQVRAMQDGGLIAATKHFAGNDQETNRHGVSTFSTEQGFREGSLRCFEGALRDDLGGGLGVMTCFNRIGATAGAAYGPVQIGILRDEWGFKGVNLTDSSKDASDYVHTRECLVGGTDMFNNDSSRATDVMTIIRTDRDGTLLKALRTANKHFYYAYSRSNLINGLTHETLVEDFVPWWKTALQALDITFYTVTGVLAVIVITTLSLNFISDRKEKGSVK